MFSVQVMGPHEVSVNNQELLGRAKAEARLLEANGWMPVHIVVGVAGRSVNRQIQHLVQAFGDPQLTVVDGRIGSGRHQGRQQGRQQVTRAREQPPVVKSTKEHKAREGWVQWKQEQKQDSQKAAPIEQEPEQEGGETMSMSSREESQNGLPSLSREGRSLGQQRQMSPSASSLVSSYVAFAGHPRAVLAVTAER